MSGRADLGSAKFLSNQLKRKQRTKIRWYCGLCHVACKDENGYKNHIESETHLRREINLGDSVGGKEFNLTKEDKSFQKKFVNFLITKQFGQTVLAHEAYRDMYPLDRGHNVIKGTCWTTLGAFVAHLRRCGLIEAQKGLRGWQIRVSSELHLGGKDDDDDDDSGSDSSEELERPVLVKKTKIEKVVEVPVESHSSASGRTDSTKVTFSMGSGKSVQSAKPSGIPNAFAHDDDEE